MSAPGMSRREFTRLGLAGTMAAGAATGLPLPAVSRRVITDSLAVIDAVAPTIEELDHQIHARAKADPRRALAEAVPPTLLLMPPPRLPTCGERTREARRVPPRSPRPRTRPR